MQSGCTTYLATYLIEEIINKGGQIIDLPNLIRLNPDVPFKTRGNGAVAIRFDFEIIELSTSPDGYNIGMNCGEVAGQTVMHFHCHVIPRYKGDMEDPRGGVRGVIPDKMSY